MCLNINKILIYTRFKIQSLILHLLRDIIIEIVRVEFGKTYYKDKKKISK